MSPPDLRCLDGSLGVQVQKINPSPFLAALRFLRLAVPRSRWLFAPDPVQRHRQAWACSRGDPPRCTVEKTRPPRFLGDPCAHAPLSDPGGPLKPSPYGSSDAAFRWDKHVGSAMKTFEAQSRGLCAPCLRFAAGVTSGPRKTRYRPVASLCRVGTSTRLDPSRRFPLQILSLSFPLLQALPGAMSPLTYAARFSAGVTSISTRLPLRRTSSASS